MQIQTKLLIAVIFTLLLAGCIQTTIVQPKTDSTLEITLELTNNTNAEAVFTTTVTSYDTPILPLFEEKVPANSSKTIKANALPGVPYKFFEKNSRRETRSLYSIAANDPITVTFDSNWFVAIPLSIMTESEANVPVQIIEKFQSIKAENKMSTVRKCTKENEVLFAVTSSDGLSGIATYYYGPEGNLLAEQFQGEMIENPPTAPYNLWEYQCNELTALSGNRNGNQK